MISRHTTLISYKFDTLFLFIRFRVPAATIDPRAAAVPLGATKGGRVPCAAPGASAAAGGGGARAAARWR